MARISKRMAGPLQLANSAATLYTVASGRRGIVRHIHLTNPTGGALTFTISIGTDAAAKRIFDAVSIAAGGEKDHYCYYPLEAAEVVQGFASAATSVVCTISGDEEVLA